MGRFFRIKMLCQIYGLHFGMSENENINVEICTCITLKTHICSAYTDMGLLGF